ncbi:hypothetical protein IHE45_05G035000 [Dioscorea alata]|uniref:Uncharacterized protein n=1 Tax=Dioscorea alata TaxID=55571 RepID=A0ACB7W0T1_DIOAL|nr:hypothetical protein IHE45_05G035000 [Dioscorea alata]
MGLFHQRPTIGTPNMKATCPKGNFETMVGFISTDCKHLIGNIENNKRRPRCY